MKATVRSARARPAKPRLNRWRFHHQKRRPDGRARPPNANPPRGAAVPKGACGHQRHDGFGCGQCGPRQVPGSPVGWAAVLAERPITHT